MSERVKVTCPSCRGAKQVMKLGAVMGSCNTCSGNGKINERDLVQPIDVVVECETKTQLKNRVAQAVPFARSDDEIVQLHADNEQAKQIVDAKRAVYKRKTK